MGLFLELLIFELITPLRGISEVNILRGRTHKGSAKRGRSTVLPRKAFLPSQQQEGVDLAVPD